MKIIFKNNSLFVNGAQKNFLFIEKEGKVNLRYFEVSQKLKVSEYVISKKPFKIKYKNFVFNSIKINGGYYVSRVFETDSIEVEIKF